MHNIPEPRTIVGLIPAAGHGRRLGPLPHSKELVPVPSRHPADTGGRPRAVLEYLLEKMRDAGVARAYIVLRDGKWDIPAHVADGGIAGLPVGYLLTTVPDGAPYTLDAAYPFVRDDLVALGFPDILFAGADAYSRLIAQQAHSGADVVLGLFPTDQPQLVDMVAIDAHGRVTDVVPKPARTTLTRTWGLAVWTPAFTAFMHEHLAGRPAPRDAHAELFVGHVVQDAIRHGLRVEGIEVSDTPCIDIGTPGNLARVLREGPPG